MSTDTPPVSPNENPDWLPIVREKVDGLRFGSVLVVVHEGKVTQVESLEKTRLDAPGRGGEAVRAGDAGAAAVPLEAGAFHRTLHKR